MTGFQLIAHRIFFLFLLLNSSQTFGEPAILRVSLENEPTTLNWQDHQNSSDRFLALFLMRGMMKIGDQSTPVCDLCSNLTINQKKTEFTFTLKSGVLWSDGIPLKAQHFVDSWNQLLEKKKNPAFVRIFQENPKAYQAPSDLELTIKLKEPNSSLLFALSVPSAFPIRKEYYSKEKKSDGLQMATQATIGPYILAAWEKGKRIVLEGNPQTKQNRPVYRVDLYFGKHADLMSRYAKGKLDIVSQPTTEDLLKYPSARVQVNPKWASRVLLLNTAKRPLSDESFRRAILLSLDRENLPAFLRTGERPTTGLIPPGVEGYRPLSLVSYDPNAAQAERHRAVTWPKRVKLKLISRTGITRQRIGQWLEQKLKGIHVDLSVDLLSESQFRKALSEKQFDLALDIRQLQVPMPLDLLSHFRSDSLSNSTGWANAGFDALCSRVDSSTSSAEANSFLQKALQLIETREVPVIPLGYPTSSFLLGRRVQNFSLTPFGDPDLVRIQLK